MNIFPWPLITNNPDTCDYKDATINLEDNSSLQILSVQEGIKIEWKPMVNSNYLSNLIEKNKLAWEVEFSCPATFLLKRIKINQGENLKVILSYNDYQGDVCMTVYIKCLTGITNFKPDGINANIPDINFTLKEGDIVGIAKINFFADLKYNRAPGVRSLFEIKSSERDDDSFKFESGNNTYRIILGKKIYVNFEKSWRNNNPAGRKAASGFVLLTPLALIIDEIRKSADNGTPTNAQAKLVHFIEQAEIDLYNTNLNSIEIALKVLEKSDVLKTCFDKISKR